MKLLIWNLQCRLSWWLEDLAVSIALFSNAVYNWRVERHARFPRSLLPEVFGQKIENALAQLKEAND